MSLATPKGIDEPDGLLGSSGIGSAGVTLVSAIVTAIVVTGGVVVSLHWASGGTLYEEILVPILAACAWVLSAYFGRWRSIGRVALLVAGATAVTYLLSDVASVDPWISLVFTFPIAGMFFAYLAARWTPGNAVTSAWAIAITGGLVAGTVIASSVIGLVRRLELLATVAGEWVIDFSLMPRGFGMTPNPNVAAMVLLVPLGFALGLTVSGSRRSRVLGGFLAATIAAGVFATGSRGAMLGTATGLAVFLWLMLRRSGTAAHSLRWPWIASGVIAVAAVVGWILRVHPTFLSRSFVRGPIWDAAIRLIAERPFLGWGAGTLALVLPGHFTDPARFQPENWHAHNVYLQAVAELGIIGALIILLGIGMGLALRRRSRSVDATSRFDGVRVGALFGFVAVLVHGLFDSAQLYPGVLAMVGFAAGTFSLSRDLGDTGTEKGASRLRLTAVASCLVVIATGYAIVHTPDTAKRAVSLAGDGRWLPASQALWSVASGPLESPSISTMLARSTAATGDIESSYEWAVRATEDDPFEWVGWMLSAQIADIQGHRPESEANSSTAYETGVMGSTEGTMEALTLTDPTSSWWSTALVTLVRRYPGVVTSAYWSSELDMPESVREATIKSASEQGVACQLLVAIGESGLLTDLHSESLGRTCRQEIDTSSILNIDNKESDLVIGTGGLFYEALFRGDELSMRDLAARLEGSSDSALARRIRGIVALRSGDIHAARAELAAGVALGDLPSVNLLLSEGDLSAETRRVVIAQGNGILASMRPLAIREGKPVPTELNHWWSLATYLPSFTDGPLIPGAWTEGVSSSVQEFLTLSQG